MINMDWLLKNVQLRHGLFDIAIQDGCIAAVERAGTGLHLVESQHTRNLDGHVMLSGLIDAHTHLDKTFATLENDRGSTARS